MATTILSICFWGSLSLILYTYLGYPLLLSLLTRVRPYCTNLTPHYPLPSVSLIIAAYNEADVIAEKITNCRALDYPSHKLEIIIGSDGSTDQTVTKIRAELEQDHSHPAFYLFAYPDRVGKAGTLNRLISHAHGEILVFSDANSIYDSNAIRALVKHFVDARVGAVCGELVLKNPNANIGGAGEGLYWRYEKFIKRLEGQLGILVAVNGAIYAIRRSLFTPLPTHKAIMDDFLTALRVLEQDYRVVYEPQARAVEYTAPDIAGEFRRKIRIGAANFNILSEIKGLLHLRHGLTALALWSHKIIRWSVPFLMIILLLTNCTLAIIDKCWLWKLLCGGQGLFYLSAVAGYLLNQHNLSLKPFDLTYYFFTANLGLLIGFVRSITHTQHPAWQRVPRQK